MDGHDSKGRPAPSAIGRSTSWLDSTVTRSPFEQPGGAVGDQLLQAMRLLAHQHGDALAVAGAVESDAHVHEHLFADALQPEDHLVERQGEVGQVDPHRHDEEALHHALLDVLDVDAAAGEVGGNPRDDAFLVSADDGDDGAVFFGGHARFLRATPEGS